MRAESELKGERNCWMAGEKRRKILAIAVLLLVSALLLLIPPWGEFRGAFGLALTLAWISGISFWKHRRVPAILGLLVVGYLAVSSVLASLQRPPPKLYTYRMDVEVEYVSSPENRIYENFWIAAPLLHPEGETFPNSLAPRLKSLTLFTRNPKQG